MEASHLLRAVGCPEEELGALLAALERLGVVRVYARPGQAGSDPDLVGRITSASSSGADERAILDLGVYASRPDWSRAQRLRKAGIEGLRAVRVYATKPRCRRRALLAYFGDETPICGGCDVCGEGGAGDARRAPRTGR